MKVKAKISFCGAVEMKKDEVRDIKEKGVLDDLLNAGYVVCAEAEEKKPAKKRGGKK